MSAPSSNGPPTPTKGPAFYTGLRIGDTDLGLVAMTMSRGAGDGPGRQRGDARAGRAPWHPGRVKHAFRNPVGGHVPVAGGLSSVGLSYARDLGAETIQVFVANPRGWATPTGNPAQDEAFRAACAQESIPAYVHAPYLINFGSHTEATVERSVDSLRHSLRRGREIGALGVVVHTGSATGGRERSIALKQVREHMLPLLEELTHDDDPFLLIESTAGQGSSLCSRAEDFGPYFEALDAHPKLGICLDTCHIFAAGHDLTGPHGMRQTLDELVATVGPGRLKLIHANDSKDVAGAHKDRHANIGEGHIGEDPFRELMRHPATEGVPLVIETPGGKEGHAADVERLKKLREQLQD